MALVATVLLVDDEKIIRTLVRVALEKSGYEVIEASTGRRAITQSRKHSGPMDLLLAELSLPRMSGLELAGTLGPERPEMSAVFLSRVPKSSGLEEQARAAGHAVVREPFRMETLLARLAKTLAASRRKPPSRSPGAGAAASRASGESQ
ncbi:MAG: response regulator [bacterium]|nr:response regulator [bacterium]